MHFSPEYTTELTVEVQVVFKWVLSNRLFMELVVVSPICIGDSIALDGYIIILVIQRRRPGFFFFFEFPFSLEKKKMPGRRAWSGDSHKKKILSAIFGSSHEKKRPDLKHKISQPY